MHNDLVPAGPLAADTPAEAKKKKPKTAPSPKWQKEARQRLDSLFSDRSKVWVIHYSCESFYDRPNGASPRITSPAVRSLDSAQTHSFSIHQVAERLKVPIAVICRARRLFSRCERPSGDETRRLISGLRLPNCGEFETPLSLI